MKKNQGYVYTSSLIIWMSVFFVIPLIIIMSFSFMTKGLYGGVSLPFTLKAYEAIFSKTLLKIFFDTLYMSVTATIIIVLLALPTAYFIARSRHKNILLFLIIIPFWTNFLIRIYAWIAILGNNGFINQALIKFNIIQDSIQFLYNPAAVIIVLAYTYLPFAVLPLYSTIEKFDFSLLEAARDLGATKAQSMMQVLLPNIKAGIFSAVLFSFIPSFGAYAIPQLVGGSSSYMLGNVIARELTITRNWPLSSAMSTILTVVTMFGVIFFILQNRKSYKAEINEQ